MSEGENAMNKEEAVRIAWIVVFFVGLLFIPTAVFLSMTCYPNAAVPKGWPSEFLYWGGFYLLTISLYGILEEERKIGIVAVVCGAIMGAASIMGPSIIQAFFIAGSGIFCGGIYIVGSAFVNVLMRREGGRGKQKLEPPQPPT